MCGLWVPNWLYTFKVASILVNSSTSNNIDICSQFSIKNSNFLSMTHKFGKSQFVSFRFQTYQFSKICKKGCNFLLSLQMKILARSMFMHGPLLLDRSVCLPLFAMWPSFGYFSTVI